MVILGLWLLVVPALVGVQMTEVSASPPGKGYAAVIEYEPHYHRLNGPGQYPYGLRSELSEVQHDLGILLFGRRESGKTRLVEKLLRTRPGELQSGSPTTKSQLYVKELPNALLYAADSIGLRDNSELKSVLELRNWMSLENVPVKRIYLLVDVSDRDHLGNVPNDLKFLMVALGVQAASKIRFVLNKCDRVSKFGKPYFDALEETLRNQFQEEFNVPAPGVLYIAAGHFIEQLYDDIRLASDEDSITLSTEDGINPPINKLTVWHEGEENDDSFTLSTKDGIGPMMKKIALSMSPPPASDGVDDESALLNDKSSPSSANSNSVSGITGWHEGEEDGHYTGFNQEHTEAIVDQSSPNNDQDTIDSDSRPVNKDTLTFNLEEEPSSVASIISKHYISLAMSLATVILYISA